MTSFLDRLLGRTEYAPTVADHEAASKASAYASQPFSMTVEDVFTITGRGTVATGKVDVGILFESPAPAVESGSVLTGATVTQ